MTEKLTLTFQAAAEALTGAITYLELAHDVYVPGNVWVISRRANVIKNDATLEELALIVAALQARQVSAA